MKDFFVYILKSTKDKKLYIGITDNLTGRIEQHNNGKSKSTKWRRPFKLVYKETYKTRSEAMKREWYFKNTREGNIWLKEKIKNII